MREILRQGARKRARGGMGGGVELELNTAVEAVCRRVIVGGYKHPTTKEALLSDRELAGLLDRDRMTMPG